MFFSVCRILLGREAEVTSNRHHDRIGREKVGSRIDSVEWLWFREEPLVG